MVPTHVLLIVLSVVAISHCGSKKPPPHTFNPKHLEDVPCDLDTDFSKAAAKEPKWAAERSKEGKPWYYVFGSTRHALLNHQILVSDAEPDAGHDFSDACLSIRKVYKKDNGDHDGFKIEGYEDKKAEYKCDKEDGCSALDHPDSTRGVEAASRRGTTEATIVQYYKDKYALGVRCSAGNAVWSVRSIEPKNIDDDTKKKVLEFIEKFDHSKYNKNKEIKDKKPKFSKEHAVKYEQKDCKERDSDEKKDDKEGDAKEKDEGKEEDKEDEATTKAPKKGAKKASAKPKTG